MSIIYNVHLLYILCSIIMHSSDMMSIWIHAPVYVPSTCSLHNPGESSYARAVKKTFGTAAVGTGYPCSQLSKLA